MAATAAAHASDNGSTDCPTHGGLVTREEAEALLLENAQLLRVNAELSALIEALKRELANASPRRTLDWADVAEMERAAADDVIICRAPEPPRPGARSNIDAIGRTGGRVTTETVASPQPFVASDEAPPKSITAESGE
jgi:hypothetical protein